LLTSNKKFIHEINFYSKKKIPFIFFIDSDCKNYVVQPVSEVDSSELLFDFNGVTNFRDKQNLWHEQIITKTIPIGFASYKAAFDIIHDNQSNGNSYLANLTMPTQIELSISLENIFKVSRSKYKLWYKDHFVFFSPEIFIKIENNKISSYPMKGTIDASIENAEEKILQNEKELAEHITIVDLIRNDLSIVADKVTVEKFRYIDKISAGSKNLLQVSSKITGELPCGYQESLGNLLSLLMPAGSVTGAPKRKTVEIIKEAENYERGYYTGVCGYYDGKDLDSCVMIRFIEKVNHKYYFKSGGGITIYSDVYSEYQELLDKIYVPAY